MDKLPVKKPRKALFKVQLNSKNPSKDLKHFRRNSVLDEEEDENNEDLDASVVLAHWKQNVATKKNPTVFPAQMKTTQVPRPKRSLNH